MKHVSTPPDEPEEDPSDPTRRDDLSAAGPSQPLGDLSRIADFARRARDGDAHALQEILERYRGRLERVGRIKVGAELGRYAEIRELMDECLSQLPEDYRAVILKRDYHGEGWDELERSLARSKHACQELHRRAWIRLKLDVMRRLRPPAREG